MNRLWMMGVLTAGMAAGNAGCYLDQLQAEQRANRVLQEDVGQARADVADKEALLRQRGTEIEGLTNQLTTKDQQVASLGAENGKLRESLTKAEHILEEMAGRPGTGSVHIVRQALPEKLSNALQALADKYPGMVEFDPKTGAVRWKADLLFPLGSDHMTDNPELLTAMKEFVAIVNSADAQAFEVVVVGHTCNTRIAKAATRAEHKTNWHLSTHRAIAVMNLLSEDGVTMSRLGCMGYGEYRPISENSSTDGKMKNRRVEIYLVQKDAVQSLAGAPAGVYETKDENMTYAKPSEVAGSPAPKTTRKPRTTPRVAPTPDSTDQ